MKNKKNSEIIGEAESISQEAKDISEDIENNLKFYQEELEQVSKNFNSSKNKAVVSISTYYQENKENIEKLATAYRSNIKSGLEEGYRNLANITKPNISKKMFGGLFFILLLISIYLMGFDLAKIFENLLLSFWTIILLPTIITLLAYFLLLHKEQISEGLGKFEDIFHKNSNVKFTIDDPDLPVVLQESTAFQNDNIAGKNIASKTKSIFNLVARLTPFLSDSITVLQLKSDYKFHLKQVKSTIEYYQLDVPSEYITRILFSELPKLDSTKEEWDTLILEKISKYLADKGHTITVATLEILHAEHTGKNVTQKWRSKNQETVNQLSKILLDTNYLATNKHGKIFYKKEDLVNILNKMETFNVSDLNTKINNLERYSDYAEDFTKFLEENGLKPKAIQLSEIENLIDTNKSFEENLITILLNFTENAIKSYKSISEEELEGFALFSLPLFFSENSYLRQKLCMKLSKNEFTVLLAHAYLEMLGDRYSGNIEEVKGFRPLTRLIDNYNAILDKERERLKNGFAKEINTLRIQLSEGTWVESIQTLVRKTLKNLEIKIDRLDVVARLKEIFAKHLRDESVQRFLEGQSVTAYLITFKIRKGSVKELLEFLNEDKYKSHRNKIGITDEISGEIKYNYQGYTTSARIGIIPRAISFNRFKAEFEKDFSIILQNKDNILSQHFPNSEKVFSDMEVIVNRFEPSERNYYLFKMPETMLETTDITIAANAVSKIRTLLSEKLKAEEQVSLIKYEGSTKWLAKLLDEPPSKLIESYVKLSNKQIEILDNTNTINQIVKKTDSKNIKELAKYYVGSSSQQRDKIIEQVKTAVFDEMKKQDVSCTTPKAKDMAENYLLSISSISSVLN